MDLHSICYSVRTIARHAGQEILDIYEGNVNYKADGSPVTIADTTANYIITKGLKGLTPYIPIISEESGIPDYSIRQSWEFCWLVDPLDGTKEFITGDSDYTVNIALIRSGEPILGVVYVPVTDTTYWAIKGFGAWKTTSDYTVEHRDIPIIANEYDLDTPQLKFAVSKSHINPATTQYINSFNKPITLPFGSSLKLVLVAEGVVDIYPRIGTTMEWDIAAADVIVREAGGSVREFGTGRVLEYNKPSLKNPYFIVYGILSKN